MADPSLSDLEKRRLEERADAFDDPAAVEYSEFDSKKDDAATSGGIWACASDCTIKTHVTLPSSNTQDANYTSFVGAIKAYVATDGVAGTYTWQFRACSNTTSALSAKLGSTGHNITYTLGTCPTLTSASDSIAVTSSDSKILLQLQDLKAGVWFAGMTFHRNLQSTSLAGSSATPTSMSLGSLPSGLSNHTSNSTSHSSTSTRSHNTSIVIASTQYVGTGLNITTISSSASSPQQPTTPITGAVLGGIIAAGVLAGCICGALVAFFLVRSRSKRKEDKNAERRIEWWSRVQSRFGSKTAIGGRETAVATTPAPEGFDTVRENEVSRMKIPVEETHRDA